ncbi:MAG: DUF1405 domain-containing protein [Anaerolineae bacterium]|nr:DUF1405 domain-containing protein [Anaerolineae bacterium]
MIQLYYRIKEIILIKWVAIPIMLAGVFGGVVGFVYWYGPSFSQYPVWQWPFVPDCPLFALLFVPSLAMILWRETRFVSRLGSLVPLYHAWVAVGLIKYGVWTDTYWVAYWINSGGHVTVEGVTMAVSHFGMIMEGLFLLSFLKMDWKTVLICALWFGLSDWMDYGPFLTYPGIDTRIVPLSLMQWHTVAVTIAMTAIYATMVWTRQRALKRQKSAALSG